MKNNKILYFFIALAFAIFGTILIPDAWKYFQGERYAEGFFVLAMVLVFDVVGIIFILPLLFTRDFRQALAVVVFYFLLNACGFQSLKTAFIAVPLCSYAGAVYFTIKGIKAK